MPEEIQEMSQVTTIFILILKSYTGRALCWQQPAASSNLLLLFLPGSTVVTQLPAGAVLLLTEITTSVACEH